jgi:hypothetical protein
VEKGCLARLGGGTPYDAIARDARAAGWIARLFYMHKDIKNIQIIINIIFVTSVYGHFTFM